MYTLSVKLHSVCVNCDFITLCIFTHTECTQCVVLHTVCNYENFPMSMTVLCLPTVYFPDLQSLFGSINHDLRYFVAKSVLY